MIPFLIIAIGVLSLAGAGAIFFIFSKSDSATSKLMRSAADINRASTNDKEDPFLKAKSDLLKSKKASKKKLTEDELLFQAGIVTPDARRKFARLKIIGPIIGIIVLGYGGSFAGAQFILLGAVMGGLVGLQLPKSILERKIAARGEDIMFFLPLVIEQISIGVSSGLAIGPCLQKVVSMADERESHNVVTEYLRLVVTLARSGLSLEDGLLEVARRSGHLELSQTFSSLAQVVRHGGEITKQLQEMGDAVSAMRETKIEAKIKRLELEATGPVAMVFMGFLLILLTCIGIQMLKAFG